MAQATQNYTAAQILEAGRRAEAEGRIDHAVQFYRHLTDHMGFTSEAATADQSLQRLAALQPNGAMNGHQIQAPNGAAGSAYHVNPSQSAGRAVARVQPPITSEHQAATQPRFLLPRSRRRYRSGRVIARVVTFVGFLQAAAGVLLLAIVIVGQFVTLPGTVGAILAAQSPTLSISAGLSMAVFGALFVLGGQLARALFDQASATRDLAIIARTRAVFEARTASRGDE